MSEDGITELLCDDVPYSEAMASEVTAIVFEHYIKHREVVLMKIQHARTATHQSIQEYDDIQGDIKNSKEFQEIKRHDGVYQKIVEMFTETAISEGSLQKIEDALLKIPRTIKKYYDILVSKDNKLQLLMKELLLDKYKRAFEVVKKIHGSKEKAVDGSSDIQSNSSPEYVLRKVKRKNL